MAVYKSDKSVPARRWAKNAHEQAGYSAAEIAAVCGIAESTARVWKKRDEWGDPPTKVTKAARAKVEAEALKINPSKGKFPNGTQAGEQRSLTHGLRTQAFNYFSANSKAIMNEALSDPEADEMEALRTAAAISLALISEYSEKISKLEAKAEAASDDIDIESGVLDSVVIVNETSTGERAGKNENLTTSKVEKKILRYAEAAEKLRQRLSIENTNWSRINREIGRLKLDKSRLHTTPQMSDDAAGFHEAIFAAMTSDLYGENDDVPDYPDLED